MECDDCTMHHHQQSATTTTNKPVVVLAGWLGCHPRNLRRYTQMYNRIGYDTIIKIGSPRSVISAMAEGPSSSSSSSQSSQPEMKNLAINTLQELQSIQPPHFILHIFSNNGCFLWEWIRFLLFAQQVDSSDFNVNVYSNLRQKLSGIVFDSAPAYYDGKVDTLQSALQFVSSPNERNSFLEITKSLDGNVVKRRFRDFWKGLCYDKSTMNIPQLYLYSQCDKLASAHHIEKLISYRRKEVLGKRHIIIWKHKFLDSEHCCHLLKYPEEYNVLVKQFLSFCTASQKKMICSKEGDNMENGFYGRSKL